MGTILKNFFYVTYALIFFCLQCYGLPYKATVWVKQTKPGEPIKTILNLHDIHLDPNEKNTKEVINAIVVGCKTTGSTLLLEECNPESEASIYKEIYKALASDQTIWFGKLASKAIEDKVKVIQADHRGEFYNLYDNLFELMWLLQEPINTSQIAVDLAYIIKTINNAQGKQLTEKESASLLIRTFGELMLNLENLFVKNTLSLFTIQELKRHYARHIALVLSEAENLTIKNEISQLLTHTQNGIDSWIKRVQSLESYYQKSPFKPIEDSLNVEDIVNKYIVESKLFRDAFKNFDFYRDVTAFRDIKNLYHIEYVWDPIFDAGVLVEIEKAFQHSNCLVIVTGGRHATSLDKFLEKQSYNMIKTQEIGDPLNLKPGEKVLDIILPAEAITAFFEFIQTIHK